jgi:hypothetical protein
VSVPFRTGPDQPRDLLALIEHEVRERIADAVDAVSLEVIVQGRRRQGLPDPVTESAADRAEFTAGVRAFLERLGAEILPALAPDQRRRVAEAATRAGADVVAGLLATQVTLARELPDYWQRFEAVRLAFTGERRA